MQPNKFFASLPHFESVTSNEAEFDENDKLDIVLSEIRDQKKSLDYVCNQYDQILCLSDTATRSASS